MNQPACLDFSLFQVKLFLAVAEARSFSRAAEAMHVEQSTLSRRIAVLEQALGFSLFNRESRPIRLTARGQSLYEQWKPLVGAFEHSLSLIYAQREEDTPTLSVCMVDSGNHLSDVPALSKQMRETCPEVNLMFHYAPMSKWQLALEEGLCDLAVTVAFDAEGAGGRFVTTPILWVPKLACVLRSNPLSKLETITYDDLRDQRFLTISDAETPKHAAYIRRICAEHGFEPKFGGRSINANGLTSLLQHDDEVLICDRFLRGVDSPLFRLFELPGTRSALYTVHLRESDNPYIEPFIQTMRDYYREGNSGEL